MAQRTPLPGLPALTESDRRAISRRAAELTLLWKAQLERDPTLSEVDAAWQKNVQAATREKTLQARKTRANVPNAPAAGKETP